VHPHILCKHKPLFWMRLIANNRLTALEFIKCLLNINSTCAHLLFITFFVVNTIRIGFIIY